MKRKQGFTVRKLLIPVMVFAALFAGGSLLFSAVDSSSGAAELRMVSDAVRSSALTCYAVEGGYPSSLDYLKTNYGLVYDEETYIVVYDAFASNVMPDIRVMERGSGWK